VADGHPVGEPEILKRDIGVVETMGFTSDGSYFYGTRNRRIDPYVAGFDPETLAVTASPRRLTDERLGSNHGPAWSPDGSLVAFIRGPRESSTLVIRSADGAERSLPTAIEDGVFAARFGVDWFPDSRSVLLQDWADDHTRKVFRQVDVATGSDRVIHEGSSHTWSAVRLSPDGKDLFYSVWESAQAVDEAAPLRLFRRDLETGDTVELFQMRSDGIGFFGLCVSPDGRQLAFSANAAPGERLLMTLPTAGGEPRVILRGTYSNPAPATMTWTRDGRYILFTAPEGNGSGPRTALWAVPTEGGAPRQLNLEMPSLLSLSLAPDGRQLAFSTSESAAEIWAIRNLLR
jgi:Tol biopolymer transport system component